MKRSEYMAFNAPNISIVCLPFFLASWNMLANRKGLGNTNWGGPSTKTTQSEPQGVAAPTGHLCSLTLEYSHSRQGTDWIMGRLLCAMQKVQEIQWSNHAVED